MKRIETLTGLFLAALGGLIVGISYSGVSFSGQEPGPGFFPLLAGSALTLCGIAIAYINWRARDESTTTFCWGSMKLIKSILISAMYPLLATIIGYSASTFINFFMLAYLFGERKWKRLAIISLFLTLSFHFTFVRYLGMPLPEGPFGF